MIIRRLSIFAFILVLASLIGIGYAQTRGGTGTTTPKSKTQPLGSYFNFYLDHAKQLKLTKDQTQQLQTRRNQFLSETQGARDSLQMAMQDVQMMLQQPNVNRDELDTRIQDTSAMLADLLVRAVNAHIEAQSILTPQQQTLASQYLGTYMRQFVASAENMATRGRTTTGRMPTQPMPRTTPSPSDTTGTTGTQ